MANIVRLDAISKDWSNAGNLNAARHGHGVIFVDSAFLVVGGGHNSFMTEKCTLADNVMTCTEQAPELDDYGFYPELAYVSEDFGDTCH